MTRSRRFNEKYDLTVVDIKDNSKIVSHMSRINRTEADIYYFTISQSKYGNLRDMLILSNLVRKRRKIVIHYHGGYYKQLYQQFNPLQRAVNRIVLSRVDIMIVLSKSLEDLFAGIVGPDKIRVCENCVEDSVLLDADEYEAKVDRLARGGGTLEVVYLSNLIRSKGYFDLLQAAEQLKGSGAAFHFAGRFYREQDEREFWAYIDRHGLRDSVTFHGVVTGDDKKQLLARCDVFALPTYYPNEGQPISIIEAMGNGLTVISTKHAGIPDLVSADNGYLIEPRSPGAIADVIGRLLRNRSKLVDFARANRRSALQRFREAQYIERLEFIMDEV